MTLDERVRIGLARSADTGRLDADEVLDGLVLWHRRGRLKRRVARQSIAIAVVLTLFVGVALLVSWRSTPARYRSVAAVAVGPANFTAANGATVKLGDPVRTALAAGTRRATLLAAHLAPDDPHVDFRAERTAPNAISLTATAPTSEASALVTREWVSVFATTRKADARRQLIAARQSLTREVATVHEQLLSIDAKLAKLDPKIYGSVRMYDAPNGNVRPGPQPGGPPPVPEHGTVKELNLVFERIQLKSRLEKLGQVAAAQRFGALAPNVIAAPIGQKAPVRVDATPAATVPALAVWIVGLVVIFAAACFMYRRRARLLRA